MANWWLALYFGFGVALTQLMHTYFAADYYGQKQVRFLEKLPGFSREDPDPDDPDKPDSLRDLMPPGKDTIHPLWPPWELQVYQWQPPEEKQFIHKVALTLGLQATNLVYCTAMAIAYGVTATLVVWWVIPSPTTFTEGLVLYLVMIFGLLLVFSFYFVGSSVTGILIEGSLALNVIAFLASNFVDPIIVLSLATFGDGLITTGLIAWLQARFSEDNGLRLGNLSPLIYVMVSFGYSELVFFLSLLPEF